MAFPLGRPMLVLLVVALTTGVWVAARSPAARTDLTVWTFSASHAQSARSNLAGFADASHISFSVESMSDRTENLRLQSIFLDPPSDKSAVPDVVEIEINQLGRFFRPPVDEVGLLPLNNLLAAAELNDQFHPARLATWSKQGVVFGLPLDVHPVALAYRADLFDAAGVDLAKANTWTDFQTACEAYQHFWREHNEPDRWAVELSRSSSDTLSILLLQQHIDLIDDAGQPAINTSKVVDTLAFYASLVAGPRRIGIDPGPVAAEAQDIVAGRVAVFLMPDWRVHEFKSRYPQLAGKMRLLPLPRFNATDAPTASWGGTMVGIPRTAPHPELAWKAIEHLLLSPEAAADRAQQEILSAIPSQWPTSGKQSDGYFGGQDVHALFVDLAEQMPSPTVDPQTVIARAELSVALSAAVTQLDSGKTSSLRGDCQRWLDWAAADLANRLAQGRLAS